jgi:type I restriction enzyme M protein
LGVEAQEGDGEPFEATIARLAAQLREQQTEGATLDAVIKVNLEALGFGGDR